MVGGKKKITKKKGGSKKNLKNKYNKMKGGSYNLSQDLFATPEFGDPAGIGTQMAVNSSEPNPLLKQQKGGKIKYTRKKRRHKKRRYTRRM